MPYYKQELTDDGGVGQCASGELITTAEECLEAAQALGLAITNTAANVYNSSWGPPGCWAQSGTFLQFNEYDKDPKDCTDFAQCLCKSMPYYKQELTDDGGVGQCATGELITTAEECLEAAQALGLAITNTAANVYNSSWGPRLLGPVRHLPPVQRV